MMENIKILIVDDMPAMRAFIKAGLRSSLSKDIAIEEAASGEAAKVKLQTQKIDLILCDWNMPGMKGSELLEWIRTQESAEIKNIPFVMVTAHNEKEIIVGAIKLGVADYLVKPITVDVLSKKVGAVLKNVILSKMKKNE